MDYQGSLTENARPLLNRQRKWALFVAEFFHDLPICETRIILLLNTFTTVILMCWKNSWLLSCILYSIIFCSFWILTTDELILILGRKYLTAFAFADLTVLQGKQISLSSFQDPQLDNHMQSFMEVFFNCIWISIFLQENKMFFQFHFFPNTLTGDAETCLFKIICSACHNLIYRYLIVLKSLFPQKFFFF